MTSDDDFPIMHASGAPYGSLKPSACKEQFSIAFLHAIATTARCTLSDPRVDDMSVDTTIRQAAPQHAVFKHPVLDVQLKCTSQEVELKGGDIAWSLESKNFNELSSVYRGPAILVLLRVPVVFEDWALHTEDALSLSKGAHWVNLRGSGEIPDGTSRTVHLPRRNHFNVEQLLGMMSRIGEGGFP